MASEPAYRPCVGIALFNHAGRVFLGRRGAIAEEGDLAYPWQMPQGGIDPGETPEEAALRELCEETNVRTVTLLGRTTNWLAYDIPGLPAPHAWRGQYRGQRQAWFAFRFEGRDSEIDVLAPGGGAHEPEFKDWRWENLERVPALVVPFKRPVYQQVAEEFQPFAKAATA